MSDKDQAINKMCEQLKKNYHAVLPIIHSKVKRARDAELERGEYIRLVDRLAWMHDLMGLIMRKPGITATEAARSLGTNHQHISRVARDLADWNLIIKTEGRRQGGPTAPLYLALTKSEAHMAPSRAPPRKTAHRPQGAAKQGREGESQGATPKTQPRGAGGGTGAVESRGKEKKAPWRPRWGRKP